MRAFNLLRALIERRSAAQKERKEKVEPETKKEAVQPSEAKPAMPRRG